MRVVVFTITASLELLQYIYIGFDNDSVDNIIMIETLSVNADFHFLLITHKKHVEKLERQFKDGISKRRIDSKNIL